eukprot:3116267-Pleurochrysis_carterae.AAC.1
MYTSSHPKGERPQVILDNVTWDSPQANLRARLKEHTYPPTPHGNVTSQHFGERAIRWQSQRAGRREP